MENICTDVEKSIFVLINKFLNNPSIYTDEKLLVYNFYDILFEKVLQRNSVYFRWEYPTNVSYKREEKGNLIVEGESKYVGRYDATLLEKETNNIKFAFEFKLLIENDAGRSLNPDTFRKEAKNDYEKITNPDNKVDVGYMVYFLKVESGLRASEGRDRRKRNQNKINISKMYDIFEKCPQKTNLKMILVTSNLTEGISERKSYPNDWIGTYSESFKNQ